VSWPYTSTEVDPVIQAEILLETGRAEARTAILVLLLAIGFGVWKGFASPEFQWVAGFATLSVVPLLVDSGLRRGASSRLRGAGPQKRRGPQL
jgi:hypothetical protein